MPHTFTFDAARKRITIFVTPPISEHDALVGLREVRTHPEFRTDYGILIDAQAVDRPPSASGAINLGNVLKVFFPGQKIALVSPNPVATEWAFLQLTARSKVHLSYFKESSEAEAWLASKDCTSHIFSRAAGD